MSWVVPDFETLSACDLKTAGADRYAEHPTTEVLCLVVEFPDGHRVQWRPGEPIDWEIQAALDDPDCAWVAHNARFEKAIWRVHMGPKHGWPVLPSGRWHCTMAAGSQKQLPQQLDMVARLLELEQQKDLEGSRLVKKLSKEYNATGVRPVITREISDRIVTYCGQDTVTQRKLHERIGWLPAGERRVYLLDQEINDRGIAVDVPLVKAMRRIVDGASIPLAAEFKELTGGLNFTQGAKVMSWCMDRGVMLPNFQKETLAAALGTDVDDGFEWVEHEKLGIPPLPKDVRRALHIRQLIGSASVKKLAAMEACVMDDGRARGLLNYHRAGPGRWAGQLIQPQNFPRGTLKEDGEAPDIEPLIDALMTGDHEYIGAVYGPAVEVVVSTLRHALIAGVGREFIAGDYAGIEARVVLALAGQHDKCALLASGVDVYCDMASDIYKRPIDKKRDPQERQIGKNSVLGLGFQMGRDKFHDRYCPEQPLDFAQEVVNTYRTSWAPMVPELWHALEVAALDTVWTGRPHEAYGCLFRMQDAWLTIRLPSDRELWYYNAKPGRKHMMWSTPENPDVRRSWTYQALKNGRVCTIDGYGGLVTENVVQGLARDILVHAMFTARRERLPIVLTVHDELVVEPIRGQLSEKAFDQMLCDVPEWCRQLKVPIATETWSGGRYKK